MMVGYGWQMMLRVVGLKLGLSLRRGAWVMMMVNDDGYSKVIRAVQQVRINIDHRE